MSPAELQAEFDQLELSRFDADTALKLGLALVTIARAEALPVVIDIRSTSRKLFHAALPGTAPLNDRWARRKSATALEFQLPSLLVGRQMAEKGQTLALHGLPEGEFSVHGGSVPIRVKGVGIVAAVTVSGLPQVEDHRLAVRALREFL